MASDDFVTGYASPTQSRTIPVHTPKIGNSFFDGMLAETTSGPILEALAQLAQLAQAGPA